MAKRIIITESQKRRLFTEAAEEGFNIQQLVQLPSFRAKVRYCEQYLGHYIGKGTSRIVYDYGNNWVLKLALNPKGIAQNKFEYQTNNDYMAPDFFPKTQEKTDDDFSFIIVEKARRATTADFKEALGMGWYEYCRYINDIGVYMTNRYESGKGHEDPDALMTYFAEHDDEGEENFLIAMYNYIMNFNPALGDLVRITSYGVAERSYGKQIVIVDNGANMDIIQQYY